MAARSLVGTAAVTDPGDDSSWVEPDYIAVIGAADRAESPRELMRLQPGPTMLMPHGLLPDGQPTSGDMLDIAERITGSRPRDAFVAETIFRGYLVQQTALREDAGIPRPRRDPSGGYLEEPRRSPRSASCIS